MVTLAGITQHPTTLWMEQTARNAVDEVSDSLRQVRFVLYDTGQQVLCFVPGNPPVRRDHADRYTSTKSNLNAFAERRVLIR